MPAILKVCITVGIPIGIIIAEELLDRTRLLQHSQRTQTMQTGKICSKSPPTTYPVITVLLQGRQKQTRSQVMDLLHLAREQ
jgi:hypothetical protein